MKIDLKQIRELIETLREFDLSELEIEQGKERIRLARGGVMSSVPQALVQPTSAGTLAATETDDGVFITSPFVGTFYRSPSPDEPPFVKVGDSFSVGAPLCIVEAMKLMNEIEAETEGAIVEIIAQDGKPVEFGDRLFKIKPA